MRPSTTGHRPRPPTTAASPASSALSPSAARAARWKRPATAAAAVGRYAALDAGTQAGTPRSSSSPPSCSSPRYMNRDEEHEDLRLRLQRCVDRVDSHRLVMWDGEAGGVPHIPTYKEVEIAAAARRKERRDEEEEARAKVTS